VGSARVMGGGECLEGERRREGAASKTVSARAAVGDRWARGWFLVVEGGIGFPGVAVSRSVTV
jgi:hypothetical protein